MFVFDVIRMYVGQLQLPFSLLSPFLPPSFYPSFTLSLSLPLSLPSCLSLSLSALSLSPSASACLSLPLCLFCLSLCVSVSLSVFLCLSLYLNFGGVIAKHCFISRRSLKCELKSQNSRFKGPAQARKAKAIRCK